MSRRPPAATDRTAQNQQTIKALLKLEGNKVCADCKRNKHPRWASWNLGIFVCIRCSGIHRGMGTHISRIKSVDLDSWTDEQLQPVLQWGNSRANRYWEAKLASGHMPSEAKIENFIRTKYESKRWVMDGPMPDPSTLDGDKDDEIPLSVVQERAKVERSASQRTSSTPPQPLPARKQASSIDLFGDDMPGPPARPSTADIPTSKAGTRAAAAVSPPVKQTKPGESLLGLDFFGNTSSAPSGRSGSAASNPGTSTSSSRPDLKQSILSLYASAPKPQVSTSESTHHQEPSLGGSSTKATTQHDAFGGLTDAFGGLSFPSSTSTTSPSTQPPQTSAFSGFGNFGSVAPKSVPSAPQITSPPPLSGGNFFDSSPPKVLEQPKFSNTSNGLDFGFARATTTKVPAPASAIPTDLFASEDFSGFATPSPAPPPVPPPTKVSTPAPSFTPNVTSAFHLSAPAATIPQPAPISAPKASPLLSQTSSSMFDPWSSGNDNGWGTPEPAAKKAPPPPSVDIGKPPSRITPNDISGGWGAPISSAKSPPAITADEEFGGWTSASTTRSPGTGPPKASGGFGASDPFDNPWG